MLSTEKCIEQGNWLFRWRSYLPLVLVSILVPAMWSFKYIGNSHTWDLVWEILCLSVSMFGLMIRCYTIGHVPKGTSGRNTHEGQIAESLNTTGIYSIVRNPLYLGNFFMMFGVILFLHSIWVSVIFSLLFWLYYERIIFAEEAFLVQKFGAQYEEYARNTPSFCPSFRNWQPSNLPFSFKNVLRREYCGLFAMILCFFVMEVVTDLIIKGHLVFDTEWLVALGIGFLIFITLRSLKKYTSLLNVEGR